MASITLHRASRLQEQIRAAIGRLPLAGTVKLSIFAADPTGDVERQARRPVADCGVSVAVCRLAGLAPSSTPADRVWFAANTRPS